MLVPGRRRLVVPARFHSGFANLSVSLWVLVNLPRRAGLIGPGLCGFPGIFLLGDSVNRGNPRPNSVRVHNSFEWPDPVDWSTRNESGGWGRQDLVLVPGVRRCGVYPVEG